MKIYTQHLNVPYQLYRFLLWTLAVLWTLEELWTLKVPHGYTTHIFMLYNSHVSSIYIFIWDSLVYQLS